MTTETIQGNKLIAEFMGTEPEVEYCVGHKKKQTICYSPKQTDYFPSSGMQKAECERYLKEQREKYPNGWVTKEGYETLRDEWYPRYHASWNELMPVVQKIEAIESDDFFGEKVRFPVTIASDKVEIGYHYYSNFADVTEECPKIVALWTVIVDFIQWYNNHLAHVSPHSTSTTTL
jgi:hypothetical protein